jgi:phosphoserine phosphatase
MVVMLPAVTLAITLVSPDSAALAAAGQALVSRLAAVKGQGPLGPEALDFSLEAADLKSVREEAQNLLAELPVDVCVQSSEGRRKGLLVADMDSTIISCECLDELADYAGVKDEIAAITERAMRGELSFEPALRERVSRLKGLPLDRLQRCYEERVRLNPGAEVFVKTMVAHGAKAFLVSGGFEFFTSRVAKAAGFTDHRGNQLLNDGALLTGLVGEPILGREAKLAALQGEAAALGLELSATLAIGDGANDLAMIEAAGLGAAYRAKPVVAAQADVRIDHADLTALLYFQGYRREDFAAI